MWLWKDWAEGGAKTASALNTPALCKMMKSRLEVLPWGWPSAIDSPPLWVNKSELLPSQTPLPHCYPVPTPAPTGTGSLALSSPRLIWERIKGTEFHSKILEAF